MLDIIDDLSISGFAICAKVKRISQDTRWKNMLRVEESDSSDSEKCEKKEYVVEEGSSIFPLDEDWDDDVDDVHDDDDKVKVKSCCHCFSFDGRFANE